jgi:hypothetical protein
MKSFFGGIDYKSGDITFVEDGLSSDVDLNSQVDLLREDMLQVQYTGGVHLLDVGWYPSFDVSGSFSVSVIENYDWSSPIYRKSAKTISSLLTAIKDAIDLLESGEF